MAEGFSFLADNIRPYIYAVNLTLKKKMMKLDFYFFIFPFYFFLSNVKISYFLPFFKFYYSRCTNRCNFNSLFNNVYRVFVLAFLHRLC